MSAAGSGYVAVGWSPGKKRYDAVLCGGAGALPRDLRRRGPLGASRDHRRDAADPRLRHAGARAAARRPRHRSAGAARPALPAAALEPAASGRHDVRLRPGPRRLRALPVPRPRRPQSAGESPDQQHAVGDRGAVSVPAAGRRGSAHPLPDGGDQPRLLADESHRAGLEDASHGRLRRLCAARRTRRARRAAGRHEPAAGSAPGLRSRRPRRAASRGGDEGKSGRPGARRSRCGRFRRGLSASARSARGGRGS